MSNRSGLNRALRAAGLAALLLLLALPALAGGIYSWRTEDGTAAFTNDPKAIPARYRDQVTVRASDGIAGYRRYTGPKAGAPSDYAERLASRLDHLRALNGDLDAAFAPAPPAPPPPIAINTGGLTIGVPSEEAGAGPVVVESLRFRHRGEAATRHNTVIRQGNRIVTVLQGDRHIGEINQAPNISEMVDD